MEVYMNGWKNMWPFNDIGWCLIIHGHLSRIHKAFTELQDLSNTQVKLLLWTFPQLMQIKIKLIWMYRQHVAFQMTPRFWNFMLKYMKHSLRRIRLYKADKQEFCKNIRHLDKTAFPLADISQLGIWISNWYEYMETYEWIEGLLSMTTRWKI